MGAGPVLTAMTEKMLSRQPAGRPVEQSAAWEPGLPREGCQAPWVCAGSGALPSLHSLAPPAFSAARGSWFPLLPSEPGEPVSLISAACSSRGFPVSGCSISSKSRCSDGAATHWAGQVPHLLTEAGRLCLCWLPTPCQCARLFVACQSPP